MLLSARPYDKDLLEGSNPLSSSYINQIRVSLWYTCVSAEATRSLRPRLILSAQGTADNTIPPRSTSTVISLLPRAQVHVIEGGSHSLILEETLGHSAEVTKVLIEFFSS